MERAVWEVFACGVCGEVLSVLRTPILPTTTRLRTPARHAHEEVVNTVTVYAEGNAHPSDYDAHERIE